MSCSLKYRNFTPVRVSCVCVTVFFTTIISWHRWYTQQNQPRARTYSWSRHPCPRLGPQQRPGSAPLYGRLCYGFQTLPVLRDYPAGPLEVGLQLTQLTQGLAGSHTSSSLLIPNQNTFEPLPRSPESSLGAFRADQTLAKSTIAERNESSEANTADAKGNEERAKVRKTKTHRAPHSFMCFVSVYFDPDCAGVTALGL